MSGETILKSSLFGGYKKEEVNQYVDSVVEENDKMIKGLQEQISYLTRENNQLKNRLNAEKKIKPKIPEKDKPENRYALENKQTVKFALTDFDGPKDPEKLPVRQQMELPEGIYIVSKEQGMVSLPEPTPVYRTKGKNTIADLTPENKENVEPETQGKLKTIHDNVATETAAEQIEKNEIIETASKGKLTNTIKNKGAEAVGARKIRKDESVPMQQNGTLGEYSDKQYAHEAELPSPKTRLPENVAEMQNELLYVKALLEKERHEKQVLAAKLEFSNDLLIQLYQK